MGEKLFIIVLDEMYKHFDIHKSTCIINETAEILIAGTTFGTPFLNEDAELIIIVVLVLVLILLGGA